MINFHPYIFSNLIIFQALKSYENITIQEPGGSSQYAEKQI
jgi:hypothetical protein